MKKRRVRFTATAGQHVERERAWWLKNRDHQEIFANELRIAEQILAILPGAGTPYHRTDLKTLRRLYLRKIDCHVYYTFDDDDVIIRALWGARRKARPPL